MRPDSRSIRLWWVPLALLLLPAVGLVPAHADLPGYFAPIRAWTAERVLMGQIPLLNPWNGCGEPWFANPQTAPLAPPTWPWLLLPAPWALTAEIALHLVWLALGAGTLARRLGADRVTAYSAGLAPTGRISSGTVKALERLGYDPSGLASKGLDAVPLDGLDIVVSLIGRQGLMFVPRRPGMRRIAWEIRDPYGEEPAIYLAVARELERRIEGLLAEAVPGQRR